jgi:hypothetical protein
MSDTANETMAPETGDEVVAAPGRTGLRSGYGRLISPGEELITLSEATRQPYPRHLMMRTTASFGNLVYCIGEPWRG